MLQFKLKQPLPEKPGFKISPLYQSIFFALTCGITGSIYAEDLQQKTVTSVEKEDVQQLESVVVVGNRGGIRTITESPAPVDVISGEQLVKQGNTLALRDILAKVIPSFNSALRTSIDAFVSAVALCASSNSFLVSNLYTFSKLALYFFLYNLKLSYIFLFLNSN